MGKFEVKIEEKAPAGASRKGRGCASGHAVRREAFVGTSEALNTLHVKFDCWEGNEGGAIFGVSKSDDRILEHSGCGGEGGDWCGMHNPGVKTRIVLGGWVDEPGVLCQRWRDSRAGP